MVIRSFWMLFGLDLDLCADADGICFCSRTSEVDAS